MSAYNNYVLDYNHLKEESFAVSPSEHCIQIAGQSVPIT
jgi:hypothetical protein